MKIEVTSSLTNDQKEAIYKLWNNEYPDKLSFNKIADLDAYLATLPNVKYYLLHNEMDEIEGWAMTFSLDDQHWFAITIDSRAQGTGKGTFLLNKLKEDAGVLYGWVIDHDDDTKQNGEKYRSPVSFYLKNGFSIFPDIRLEISVLSAAQIIWHKQ